MGSRQIVVVTSTMPQSAKATKKIHYNALFSLEVFPSDKKGLDFISCCCRDTTKSCEVQLAFEDRAVVLTYPAAEMGWILRAVVVTPTTP